MAGNKFFLENDAMTCVPCRPIVTTGPDVAIAILLHGISESDLLLEAPNIIPACVCVCACMCVEDFMQHLNFAFN